MLTTVPPATADAALADAIRTGEDNAPASQPSVGSMPQAAFADLIDQYQSPLLRYARRLLSGAEDAEDVVQDAFVQYHRQMQRPVAEQPDNARSWLYRVVHNRAMDLRRLRKRRQDHQPHVTDQARALANLHDAPDDDLVRQEAMAHTLAALEELPEEQRQILTLKIMHGLTLREVADVLNMPFANVNYRLNKALLELAGKLKQRGVV